MLGRRGFLGALAGVVAAPMIVRTPGLLMPVKRVVTISRFETLAEAMASEEDVFEFSGFASRVPVGQIVTSESMYRDLVAYHARGGDLASASPDVLRQPDAACIPRRQTSWQARRVTHPYAILSLPRSRTFWLSRLLGCAHDPSLRATSRAAMAAQINDGLPFVETGLGLIWHEMVPGLRVDLRVAVIHRPVADVLASLDRIGLRGPETDRVLAVMAERLIAIAGAHFTHSQIGTYEGCARLAHFCTGEWLDFERWGAAVQVPAECDIAAARAEAARNADGLRAVYGGSV